MGGEAVVVDGAIMSAPFSGCSLLIPSSSSRVESADKTGGSLLSPAGVGVG